jgi:hypothetical protein
MSMKLAYGFILSFINHLIYDYEVLQPFTALYLKVH